MSVEGAWVFRLFDGEIGVRLSRGLYIVPNQVQAVTVEQLSATPGARLHIHLKGGADIPIAEGETREIHEMAKTIVEGMSSFVWEDYTEKLPDLTDDSALRRRGI